METATDYKGDINIELFISIFNHPSSLLKVNRFLFSFINLSKSSSFWDDVNTIVSYEFYDRRW